MRSLGIDIAASDLRYVVIEVSGTTPQLIAANTLQLAQTRDVKSIKAFQTALAAVFTEATPSVVAIRAMLEKGRMGAGAAALKIEALVLAQSLAPVRFYTNQRLAKQTAPGFNLPGYFDSAIKAALAAIDDG